MTPTAKHRERAKVLYDALGRGSTRDEEIIARALAKSEDEAKDHWLAWHAKRMEASTRFWVRAAKAALNGDLRELRNRVELCEAGEG